MNELVLILLIVLLVMSNVLWFVAFSTYRRTVKRLHNNRGKSEGEVT